MLHVFTPFLRVCSVRREAQRGDTSRNGHDPFAQPRHVVALERDMQCSCPGELSATEPAPPEGRPAPGLGLILVPHVADSERQVGQGQRRTRSRGNPLPCFSPLLHPSFCPVIPPEIPGIRRKVPRIPRLAMFWCRPQRSPTHQTTSRPSPSSKRQGSRIYDQHVTFFTRVSV